MTASSARCLLLLIPSLLTAKLYEVGPNQAMPTPEEVPWESLGPGDTVRIHWRAEPYRNKWVICRQGTQAQPITIEGVSGPDGQQPIIDAANATTRPQLDYWGAERSLIKIGGASKPADTEPAHILIENLELRGARKGHSFTDNKGRKQAHTSHAASIYIEKGHHITVRGCTLHDNGNGLMTSHGSRDILVEACHIHSNGTPDSIYHHNIYTESLRITFRHNRFCTLTPGARGNNLKDRSAGLRILHNTIYGGNKQLDLVDAEGSAKLRQHPDYPNALVDGNFLIELEDDGNNQLIHFGGDSPNRQWYRSQLTFRNNHVLTYRKDATILFRLNDGNQLVICEHNRFLHAGGPKAGNWEVLTRFGHVEFRRPNHIHGKWIHTSYKFGIHKISNPRNLVATDQIPRPGNLAPNAPFHLLPCEHHKH